MKKIIIISLVVISLVIIFLNFNSSKRIKINQVVLSEKINNEWWNILSVEDEDIFLIILSNENSKFKWEIKRNTFFLQDQECNKMNQKLICYQGSDIIKLELDDEIRKAVANNDHKTIKKYIGDIR